MGKPTHDQFLSLKWLANPTSWSVSSVTARSAVMVAKQAYTLMCTTNCFFLQGDNTVTATSSAYPLAAWQPVTVYCENATTEGYVAVITTGTSGTAYLMKGAD